MADKRQKKRDRHGEYLPPREDTVQPCAPESIEQKLDMCETGDLKGDEIQFHHGVPARAGDPNLEKADELEENYNVDMAESGREGDDMSGDEHSSGLQGDSDAGIPGDQTQASAREVARRKRRTAA